jgi:hemoglobin
MKHITGCDSHRHLMITEDEWLAFMDDLDQTFDKFNVPKAEREELIAIVEVTKEGIVVAPSFQAGPTAPANETPQP